MRDMDFNAMDEERSRDSDERTVVHGVRSATSEVAIATSGCTSAWRSNKVYFSVLPDKDHQKTKHSLQQT